MEALLEIPPGYLAAAFLVTVLAAGIQGTIGLGFAIFSVPILSLLDPRLAPVPQLLVSVPLTLSMALRERHAIEIRPMVWVLVGRIPGAFLGVWLLTVASKQLLDILIGGVVLVAVVVLSSRLSLRRNSVTELLAGVASGASGMVSSIGGPPLALLYRDERGASIRANLAAIFAIGLVITISGRLLAGRIVLAELLVGLTLLPALAIGLLISRQLIAKVEGEPIRRGVLIISALAAVALLSKALLA